MASIAVLPVLIGLAVDYAIQFQARFNEARAEGPGARAATAAAGSGGGPVIGAACVADGSRVRALVLADSDGPLLRDPAGGGRRARVRAASTAGFAAVVSAAWRPRRRLRRRAGRRPRPVARERAAAAPRPPAPSRLRSGRPAASSRPPWSCAACGWIASTRTEVVSDIRDLAPSDLPALRDVDILQEETGVSGEVNAVVRSDDLTDPEVIAWMTDFQARVLERGGFAGDAPTCESADICPAVALTDLFPAEGGPQTQEQAEALIAAIPPYFSQAVVTRDELTGAVGDAANIAFGIRVQPLDDQQRLIEGIREEIEADGGPRGDRGGPEGPAGDRRRG